MTPARTNTVCSFLLTSGWPVHRMSAPPGKQKGHCEERTLTEAAPAGSLSTAVSVGGSAT